MNFISTFDELNKLYEAKQSAKDEKKLDEYWSDEEYPGHDPECPYPGRESRPSSWSNGAPKWWLDQGGTEASWKAAVQKSANKTYRNPWEGLDKDCKGDKLTEAEDAEIEIVDDEPRQIICECDKCGALVIKAEADIVADEESGLVNIEDECQFCEEAKGFKIIGVVAPYEAVEEEIFDESDEAPEEPIEEAFESLRRIEWKKMKGKYDLTPIKGSEIKKGDLIIQAPAEQINNLDDDDFAVYAMKVTQEGDETEIEWGGSNGTDYWRPDNPDYIKATKKAKK
jgi:hypothetical protein